MAEVVVPWTPGCAYRERAWRWLRPRYGADHTVRVAPGSTPWVKARAVMPAVAACTEDAIVVVADADVWSDDIAAAIAAVDGGAAWAMPHDDVHRLDEAGTAAVYAGADPLKQPLDQPPYRGVWGGGIVVARREVILSTPLDPRFVGWG